jgi:ribosomal protein S18 acetylase RimI-like enzyme
MPLIMEAELRGLDGYSVQVVRRSIDDALRAELVAFWAGQGAIPDPVEAQRRADEVVCVARDASGAIVAVNSVYAADFRAPGDRHYFYRQFARPQDRRLGLGVAMLRQAVASLRQEHREGDAIKGIVLVAENPKLSRKSGRRLLAWLGWTFLGKGPRGFDLWRIDFNGPQSPAPP